nr:zinc finger protein OZF-like [Halyomorpha halys]
MSEKNTLLLCHCGSKFTAVKHLLLHKKRYDKPNVASFTFAPTLENVRISARSVENASISSPLSGDTKSVTHVTSSVGYHSGQRPYKCQECGRCYTDKRNLTKHMKSFSKCKEAAQNFICRKYKWLDGNNISLKRDGNQKEKSANLNSCPLCKKQFQNSETLQKHEEKHFGNIQCEICSKKFSSLKKLSIHSSRHSKKYICSFCNYASHSSSNFKIHLMKHNKQCLIECEDCGKGFYSLSYYREHRSVKHSNEIVINKCEFCQKAYHSKFYLNQHLKIHSPDFVKKTFQCELCGKTFQSWKGMKKHANSIHDRAKHKCDLCGKEVTCLQSLKNHKKIHSGEKSFVCDICGKGFIALNNLVVHERIHSGEKPYKCDQCDKSFSQQSTLKVHKRCHSGEKPYPCYQCNKRFITRSHMKKHEKTHKETEKNV